MLSLRVTLLSGRYVATAFDDRQRVEWPPHPARVFSALVAAWASQSDPTEAEALRWLESLPAPALVVSEANVKTDARAMGLPLSRDRQQPIHYVPVDDQNLVTIPDRLATDLVAAQEARQDAEVALDQATDAGARKRGATSLKRALKDEQVAQARWENELSGAHTPSRKALSKADLTKASHLLPDQRARQPRTLPSIAPEEPGFTLRWPHVAEIDQPASIADSWERHIAVLDALCARVARVGHSASLVAISVAVARSSADAFPTTPTTWVPVPRGEAAEHVLRVPGPGQFDQLVAAYAVHRESAPRVMPAVFQGYARPTSESPRNILRGYLGADWIVLRFVPAPGALTSNGRLPIHRGVAVATVFRRALIKAAADAGLPVADPVLSGHEADGAPLRSPHLAVIPLADVGHGHAHGDLLGLALSFPRLADESARQATLGALAHWENQNEDGTLQLNLGRAGVRYLEREIGRSTLHGLSPEAWTRPSRQWTSVSPVALGRNPGNLYSSHAEVAEKSHAHAIDTIIGACELSGLPRPNDVYIHPNPTLRGCDRANAYGPFPVDQGRHRRVLIHVDLTFPTPVAGPVLIGAGRYLGLGLFRPLNREDQETEA